MCANDNRYTLYTLARAVEDLADGMGGDVQEEYRAWSIGAALIQIANGEKVAPLLEHDEARERWLEDERKYYTNDALESMEAS